MSDDPYRQNNEERKQIFLTWQEKFWNKIGGIAVILLLTCIGTCTTHSCIKDDSNELKSLREQVRAKNSECRDKIEPYVLDETHLTKGGPRQVAKSVTCDHSQHVLTIEKQLDLSVVACRCPRGKVTIYPSTTASALNITVPVSSNSSN